MLRLLNIELQKLLLNKKSKILIFISFILPFFIILLSSLKIPVFGLFTLELGKLGIFNFPITWHLNTYFASQFKYFFAIVVVSMIGNEYSNKTIKQNLIDGLSKKEFVLSKFYAIVFFSFVSTVLIGFISLSSGLYYSSNIEVASIVKESEFLIAYFVKLIGFFSLCLFFAILVKRSAFALAFLFLLYIAEWIIFGIASWFTRSGFAEKIHNILPLNSMSKLIDHPFQRIAMLEFENSMESNYDYAVHGSEVLIVLFWVAMFIFLSFILLKKRDL